MNLHKLQYIRFPEGRTILAIPFVSVETSTNSLDINYKETSTRTITYAIVNITDSVATNNLVIQDIDIGLYKIITRELTKEELAKEIRNIDIVSAMINSCFREHTNKISELTILSMSITKSLNSISYDDIFDLEKDKILSALMFIKNGLVVDLTNEDKENLLNILKTFMYERLLCDNILEEEAQLKKTISKAFDIDQYDTLDINIGLLNEAFKTIKTQGEH